MSLIWRRNTPLPIWRSYLTAVSFLSQAGILIMDHTRRRKDTVAQSCAGDALHDVEEHASDLTLLLSSPYLSCYTCCRRGAVYASFSSLTMYFLPLQTPSIYPFDVEHAQQTLTSTREHVVSEQSTGLNIRRLRHHGEALDLGGGRRAYL